MRRLGLGLIFAGLALCVAPMVWAEADSSAKPDKAAEARLAEEKGDVARAEKEYLKALIDYNMALKGNRQSAALYNKMGVCQLQLHQRSQARHSFNQAVKLDPQLVAAINNSGVMATVDKRYKSAVDLFKKALALDELNAPIHLNLAEAWFGLGDGERAMTEYSRAIEIDADVLNSAQGGVTAQMKTPEQQARANYLIAKAYMKRGNIDGALDRLARARQGGFPEMKKVYTDPDFKPLWDDPRLAKIVKR